MYLNGIRTSAVIFAEGYGLSLSLMASTSLVQKLQSPARCSLQLGEQDSAPKKNDNQKFALFWCAESIATFGSFSQSEPATEL